jgi:hypothetical protein
MWFDSLRSRLYEFFWLLRERVRWRKIAKRLDSCIMCGEDVSHTNSVVFMKDGYPDYSWCWSCYQIHGLGLPASYKETVRGNPIVN